MSISCGQKALGVVVLELSSMHSVTTSQERSTILGLRAQQGTLACLWGNMHSRSEHREVNCSSETAGGAACPSFLPPHLSRACESWAVISFI